MQTDVLPFFKINVDAGCSLQMFHSVLLYLAVLDRSIVGVALNHVIARTGRHTNGKFAVVVRETLPVGMLLARGMDFHFHAIERVVIRPIGGARDDRKVFPRIVFALVLVALAGLVLLLGSNVLASN